MRSSLRLFTCALTVLGCGGDDTGRDDAGYGSLTAVTASPPGGSSSGGAATGPGDGTGGAATHGVEPVGPRFDLGPQPDLGPLCGAGGEPDFSYIWIANSSEGTISKINTETLVEEGRYVVRPDQLGSPSRTSVNLSGDVVVANRNGGLTKVYARPERCRESNGTPGLQTSNGPQFLPWGVEECVAWYTPMNFPSQRPAAWTQGELDPVTCQYGQQKAWTSGNPSADGTVEVLRVDGETGAVEATVLVSGLVPDFYGVYGAAVDRQGNFWGSQLGVGKLVFVDHATLQWKTWDMIADGYGMTVGASGYVWTCSFNASRFDPMTETWQTVPAGEYGGCMEDGEGTLYKSTPDGLMAIDVETLAVKQVYGLPEHVHGISVDFYGLVWGVAMGANAYRVDPKTGDFETFTGLVGAYTYSDMTGFALRNVGKPTG